VVTDAMRAYVKDVKEEAFPTDEYCYHMLAGEAEKFETMIKDYE